MLLALLSVDDLLLELEPNEKKREAIWKDIAAEAGSVQHLKILTDEQKEVFKTAPELNQIWIIEHAKMRQDMVCQSQSVNLFFVPPKATEPQEIHDDYPPVCQ